MITFMRTFSFGKLVLVASLFLLAGLTAAVAEEQSEIVKLKQVPPAVAATISSKTGEGKAKLGDIERVVEEGETRYDVEISKGKVERTFSVAPDGKILSWQVFMHEVRPPAQKTIRELVKAAQAKLGDIDRVEEEGKIVYEVTMTKDEREIAFSVSAQGKLLTIDITMAEAPAAVQKAILTQAAGSVVKQIERNTEDEDGDVAYDVEAEKAGKKVSFSVDSEGKLLED